MGARAAGSRMADLISDLLWQPLGTELDAEITCDVVGSAVHDGGISTTTRDLARFGQMVLVDHSTNTVAVKFSTWPDARNPKYLIDTIRAFTAAGRHLAGLAPGSQDRKGGPLVDAG
ncbi:MAG: hypothetical protein M3P18_01720 [Actinomycetota bacterium]|nr:hypothetical protein [Actinomycetota bacterium]